MNSVKLLDRPQRFKIQVVKKKCQRVQSTPRFKQNSQLQWEKKQSTNEQYKNLDKKSQGCNPEVLSPPLIKHKRSLSSYDKVVPLNQQRSGVKHKNIKMNNSKLQGWLEIIQSELRLAVIVERKLQEQKLRNKKKDYINPFQDMNIVTCHSITLLQTNKKKSVQCRKPSSKIQHDSKSRRVIKMTNLSTSRIMSFNLNSDPDIIYMKKMKLYFDFLFKVNFSNRLFINMQLKEDQEQAIQRYKVYVGWGNNHQIIKYCLKSRFWVEVVDRFDDPNVRLFWTPWPVKDVFFKQKDCSQTIQYSSSGKTKNQPKLDQEQVILNKKLFIQNQQCQKVQNFILANGYMAPFVEHNSPTLITNHLIGSTCISQKRKLFQSLFHYYSKNLNTDPFTVIPLTYSVTGIDDPEYRRFMRDNQQKIERVWIIKPGEHTNRGEGIQLAKTSQVEQILTQNKRQSYIIQAYIEKPLLYNNRKFDIRHFLVVTSVNGILKAYWFKQGYIRTSSEMYNIDNLKDKFIHLTNDAIQQNSKNYGTHQASNKVSYSQFQRYLQTIFNGKTINFQQMILPQMKQIMRNTIKANYKALNSHKKQANFQLFGIDFMIDRELKPWLIQVNQNPCLQTNCALLSRLIHSLVENTLRLCFDPLFPPRNHYPAKQRASLNDHYLRSLKFELIFDELSTIQEQESKKINIWGVETC